MRMEEVSNKVLGYNNKTKHMSGVLIPLNYESDRYSILPFEYCWDVQDIHEFIKTYKRDLLEYAQGDGLVFLAFKDGKSFEDIEYTDDIKDSFEFKCDYVWSEELEDWQEECDYQTVVSSLFDIGLCKELNDYLKESMLNELNTLF